MSSVEAKLSSKFPRNVIFILSYSFHIISVTSEVIFVSNHFDKDVIWLFSQNSPFYLTWGRVMMMMMMDNDEGVLQLSTFGGAC